jgi:hypothetical protein
MNAKIATAALKLRLDINFGDAVTPEPQIVELPALRPGAAPIRVLGYPVETVLAEKIATAIDLGPTNTRVRDYADIYTLTGSQNVDHGIARETLLATAASRCNTLRPLSEAVGNLVELRARIYAAYRNSLGQYGEHLPERFEEVVAAAALFADPLTTEASPATHWDARSRIWSSLD